MLNKVAVVKAYVSIRYLILSESFDNMIWFAYIVKKKIAWLFLCIFIFLSQEYHVFFVLLNLNVIISPLLINGEMISPIKILKESLVFRIFKLIVYKLFPRQKKPRF